MNTTTEQAITGGCPVSGFVLPGISPEVPAIGSGHQRRLKVLARLALIAEDEGWELPVNPELDVSQVFATQIADYANKKFPNLGHCLKADIDVVALDDMLQVVIRAKSELDVYRMKPVVLALEQAMTGLGWFVAKTAIHLPGELSCYDPRIMTQGYNATAYWDLVGAFTDENYAKRIIDEWGNGEDDERIDEDGGLSESAIQSIRDEYGGGDLWPSDIAQAVEGHIHLAYLSDLYPWPAISAEAAQQWLDANTGHELASVVSDALRMLNHQSPLNGSFTWDHSDDEDCIGAMAFIVWDEAAAICSAAEQHEIDVMESGCCGEEAIGRYVQAFDKEPTDEQLKAILMALNNYLERWNLAEKLVSNFPKMEFENES